MPSRKSKRLVIDTSIARSSGGKDAVHPTSKHCRDFLQAVLKICHQVVMSEDIEHEWDNHQSNFARMWRTAMVSKRKVCAVSIQQSARMRSSIQNIAHSEKAAQAMIKDVHLIEAAIATDKIVFSLDEEVRTLFRMAAASIVPLRKVHWANPDNIQEGIIEWLENGARMERERWLGVEIE